MQHAETKGRRHNRIAWLVAPALLLALAAQANPATAQEETEPAAAGTVTPPVVREQRQAYDDLRQTWNQRRIPAGMSQPQSEFTPRSSGVRAVALEANNVNFYLGDGIGFYIEHLTAALVPKEADEPVNFDDPEQYDIHILNGEILLRPSHLDALFNRHILTYQPRSIIEVENRTREDTLEVSVDTRAWTVLPPLGHLPATLSGDIEVTDDNWLVYTPQSVTSLGLPLKPLLSTLNLSLGAVTPLERTGVKLEGNQLLMDPERIFPPPRFRIDNITEAALSEDGLRLSFSSDIEPEFTAPPVDRDSYIWLQSGDARFFGVVLVNAHLQLLNQSEESPLTFALYHYRAQAAAGTIKVQQDGSLIVRVPNDFERNDRAPEDSERLEPRSVGGE